MYSLHDRLLFVFSTSMDFLMATGAQALEIALVIRSAIGDGLHMMDEGCYHCSPQPKALLAERMRRDVSVAHLSPVTSVPLVLIVATGEMLIMPLHHAPMFLAVARPAVGQIRTAAISARAFRFRWQSHHLGNKKPPQGLLPLEVGFRSTFLSSISYHCQAYERKMNFSELLCPSAKIFQ